MQMTENEIKREVLGAKNQRAQIQIVADQNDCEPEVIKEILKELGVDLRSLKGEKKQIDHGTKHKPHKKPYKKPEIIPAPTANAEKNAENAEKKSALTELNERIELLMKEKAGIEDEINDLRSRLTAMIDKLAGGSNNESTQT